MTTGSQHPILELRNVQQEYMTKSGAPFVLFKDLDIAFEDYSQMGQFIVIMGPSGCGKSTILKYFTNLQKPTSGEVLIKGKPLEKNQSIPMVFQSYSSLEWYSVWYNVALPLILRGVSKSEAKEKAMQMLKVVGLEEHADKYAKNTQLSGGQLQRVAIARSLIANSEMLMLDEPFGALDIQTRSSMQFFLLDLFQQSEVKNLNPTVVLVTHDPSEAVMLGADIYIMDANPGRFIHRYKPELPAERDHSIRKSPKFQSAVSDIEDLLHNVKK